MKKLINYPTRTGAHCGSTAMRSLLHFHCKLDLSEAMVAGLGSVIDCVVIEVPLGPLPFLSFGRGLTMERDSTEALGIGYSEQPDPDDARAWEVVRNEVVEGRPTMLSGDPYYTSYHPLTTHFPSHRFVLVGFDDEQQIAWVVDRSWTEPQACPYEELAAARNPKDWPITTTNLWGHFEDPRPTRSLEEACRLALGRTAARLLGEDRSQVEHIASFVRGAKIPVASGLEGVRRLRRLLPTALESNAPFVAQNLANTFERQGTGGGNFRVLFASFLDEASALIPDLVKAETLDATRRSAAAWTSLASELAMLAKANADDALRAKVSRSCDAALATIEESEEELAKSLAVSQ